MPIRLLRPRAAAAMLGISEMTLQRWRTTGRPDLPYSRLGRSVVYSEADLLAFIEANRHASPPSAPSGDAPDRRAA